MECVGAIVREFVRETLLSMCIEYRYICDNMYVTMHTFMHEYPGVLRRPERLVCQEERGTPQNFACQNGHKSLMQRLGPFARHDGDKCIINIFGPTQCTFLIDTFDVEKEICATKLQYITHIFM